MYLYWTAEGSSSILCNYSKNYSFLGCWNTALLRWGLLEREFLLKVILCIVTQDYNVPPLFQAHEILALETLTLLLHKPTDDSVEVAVCVTQQGSKLQPTRLQKWPTYCRTVALPTKTFPGTVNSPLVDTLVSGQLYLRTLFSIPVFTS